MTETQIVHDNFNMNMKWTIDGRRCFTHWTYYRDKILYALKIEITGEHDLQWENIKQEHFFIEIESGPIKNKKTCEFDIICCFYAAYKTSLFHAQNIALKRVLKEFKDVFNDT